MPGYDVRVVVPATRVTVNKNKINIRKNLELSW